MPQTEAEPSIALQPDRSRAACPTPVQGLRLELRAGETLLINGAEILFDRKAVIVLPKHAAPVSLMFGKQVMAADEATTDLRRIYIMVQHAYAGRDFGDAEQATGRIVDTLRANWRYDDAVVGASMKAAAGLVCLGQWHAALKVLREMIRADEERA